MPKAINKTIGKCKCYLPKCDQVCDIRKMKATRRGDSEPALYLYCKEHGTVNIRGNDFQEHIITNGEFYPGGEKPDQEQTDQVKNGSENKPMEVKTDDFQSDQDWTPDQEQNNQVNQVPDAKTDQEQNNQVNQVPDAKTDQVKKSTDEELEDWFNG